MVGGGPVVQDSTAEYGRPVTIRVSEALASSNICRYLSRYFPCLLPGSCPAPWEEANSLGIHTRIADAGNSVGIARPARPARPVSVPNAWSQALIVA